MEDITEELIQLSGFAPLIQIWAGICLLFFYEILLSNFPLEKFESFQGIKWSDHFLPTIKNMACLSFFYSVFLLICVGIENTQVYAERMVAIQIIDFAIWVYMVIAIMFTGWKLFHTYWTPVIYIILIVLYYHVFPCFNGWLLGMGLQAGGAYSYLGIIILTLFSLASPLFLIIIHLFYDWLVFKKRKSSLKKLNENFQIMTKAMLGLAKPADFPKVLQKKVLERVKNAVLDKGEVKSKDLNDYLTEEIKDEFDAFTSSWIERMWRKLGPSKVTITKIKNILRYFFLACCS